jgi:glucose-6-phosphate 1-epimerase
VQTFPHPQQLVRTSVGGQSLVASTYGGQVLSWVDDGGREQLYLSPMAVAPQVPVRGGVPVCFPQFATRGPLDKHGFVRTATWEVVDADAGRIHMKLASGTQEAPALRPEWAHPFECDLVAQLSPGGLRMTFGVRNLGTEPWPFTAALHTYLRVADVAGVRLEGLAGHEYEDALAGGALASGPEPDLRRPLDRVYREIQGDVLMHASTHGLRIRQGGFADVVVWNPGSASRPPDLPEGDERYMLCIEAAQVAKPVRLEPGASWQGWQSLELLKST